MKRYAIARSVHGDFEALHMSTAMLMAGVEPFSIVVDPRFTDGDRWIVFGRYAGDVDVESTTKVLDYRFTTLMGWEP